jgi:release factor glutamine methyltransferase
MSQNNTIEQLLLYGKSILKEKNIESWAIDAQVLLMYVTKFTKVKLFSHNKQLLNDDECNYYRQLINKRSEGYPVQYITGIQEFMSLDFIVNSYTLIPRADTEILVETLLEVSKKQDIKRIMDIGTGTGCIPISLAYYNTAMKAIAIDISDGALEVARKNADKHRVSDKIEFIKSDLFENLSDEWIGKLDAIVSNPPYIRQEIIPSLMREVREYEPITALVGGIDGLDFYRKITKQGYQYIRQGGFLLYEIGYDQATQVTGIMQQQGFVNIQIIKDLAGLDRVVIGNKN